MFYKGFLKRIIPFFLTFAAGLFIASFFVSIAAPNFNWRRGRSHRMHECWRVNTENEELRRDSYRMKRELEELRRKSWDMPVTAADDIPVYENELPLKAPRRPKHDR